MELRRDPGSLPARLRSLAQETTDRCLELLQDGQLDPAKNIHECRKRLKWLRALLRAGRPALSGKEFSAQNVALRDAGRLLASFRARSAQRSALHQVAEHFGLPFPEHAARVSGLGEGALRSIEHESAADRRAARELLQPVRRRMTRWLADLDDEEAAAVFVEGSLGTWRKARAEYRQALRKPTSEQLHTWRKHVKYHLHQLRFAGDQSPVLRERARELRDLGEILGDAHDLVDLQHSFAQGGGFVEGDPDWDALLRAREAELSLTALEQGARLFSGGSRRLRRHLREALAVEANVKDGR